MRERYGKRNGIEKNIVVISNITLEPYFFNRLWDIAAVDNVSLHLYDLSYSELMNEECLNAIESAKYLFVVLRFQEIYPNAYEKLFTGQQDVSELVEDTLCLFRNLLKKIRRVYSGPILWTSLEDYDMPYDQYLGDIFIGDGLLDTVNISLCSLFRADGQSVFLDIKKLIAKIGVENAYSFKNHYRWNAPYSKKMSYEIAAVFWKQVKILEGNTPKCIVLDCDNVLWGGVLSEDGLENIQIGNVGYGKIYQDFQRFLLSLFEHGILLALCSKNDLIDVEKVFDEHSGMILKNEHIACYRVNWKRKDQNLLEIAQELNLSPESMVFVDDSAFEINWVQQKLPNIRTVRFCSEKPYEGLSVFNLRVSKDIGNIYQRNETYRTNEKRRALAATFADYEEYLIALDMIIDIKFADKTELLRISELSSRTNQCTNGRRYRVSDLVTLQQNEYCLYAVYLKDKFSNLGLVGCIGMQRGTLDLFCLSCRALGRRIEEKMFDFIKSFSVHRIYCSDTGKNGAFLASLREAFDSAVFEGGEEFGEKILSNVVSLSSIRTGCYNTALLCSVFRFQRDFRHFMLWDMAKVDFRDLKFKMEFLNVFELDELMNGVGLHIQSVQTKPENFIETVCCHLNQDSTVLTYLDVFAYSNFSATYQKIHSEHCIMLFGYEKEKRIFHIVDHDYIEDFIYRKKTASYDDIRDSFSAYLSHYHPRTYVETVGEVRQSDFIDIRDTVQKYLSYVTSPQLLENNQNAFTAALDFLNKISGSEREFIAHANQYYITTNSLFNKRMYEYQAFSRLFGENHLAVDVLEYLLDRYNFVRSIMYKTKISHIYRKVSSEKSAAAFAEICLYEKQYNEILKSMRNHVKEAKTFDYAKEISLNGSFQVF